MISGKGKNFFSREKKRLYMPSPLPSEAKGANPQRHVCRQEKRNIFVSVGCKRTIQLSPLKGNTAFL
jgi:hypothetical protein